MSGIASTERFSASIVSVDRRRMHHASIRQTDPLTAETNDERWAYAISFPLDTSGSATAGVRAVRITLDVVVTEGRLGVLIVADDWTTVLTTPALDVARGDHRIELVFDRIGTVAHLVLRNNTPPAGRCVFAVRSITAEQTEDTTSITSRLSEVLHGHPPRIHLPSLGRGLASSAGITGLDSQPVSATEQLSVVPVDALHDRLGLPTPLAYPASSRTKPLVEWRMEVDDAPILRYLYRSLRPRRHLEFGTWEGTGACYCLSECEATVWTINLPEGELIDNRPAYHSMLREPPTGAVPIAVRGEEREYQTDAGVFIGHRYRSAGFGHRVCQILCDSRDWDISAYPRDFFDSVLIDGGHSEDVVVSDTRKALAATRSGALILWHDFCPDPLVFSSMPSTTGVLTAILKHWDEVRDCVTDIFWIQPSFLLAALRR